MGKNTCELSVAAWAFTNSHNGVINTIRKELMDTDEQTYKKIVEAAKVQTLEKDGKEYVVFLDRKKRQFIMFPISGFLCSLDKIRKGEFCENDREIIVFIKRLMDGMVGFEANEYMELKEIIDRELLFIYKMIDQNGRIITKEMNKKQSSSLYDIKKNIRKYLGGRIGIISKNREFQRNQIWEYEITPGQEPLSTLNDRMINIMDSLIKLSKLSPDRNKEEVLSFLIEIHLLNIGYIEIEKR